MNGINGKLGKLNNYILLIFLILLFVNIHILNSQCHTTSGNLISFTASGQNSDPNYTTSFALTDYVGQIISISSTTSFSGQATGLYKIYGINYLNSSTLSNYNIGNNINTINGSCLDVGQPMEVLICNNPNATCNTFNGSFSFNSTGGNLSLTNAYVLTDLVQNILKISNTNQFTEIPIGDFIIFPINYDQINNLSIGQNIHNLSGNCYDIGNPIIIKSCENCNVDAGETVNICSSQTVNLIATGSDPGSYVWNTGQNGNSINVTPTQTTTYSVTFTSSDGCIATDDVLVNINQVNANITGDNNICLGESTSLIGSGGTNYTWSTGDNTAAITINPSVTTTYTVTVTDANSCSATANSLVTVNSLPNIDITGDNNICSGESTSLTASGGTNYTWSTGDNTAAITINPSVTTTYTVTVTDANSCSATANSLVIVNQLPDVNITGDGEICIGENTTLTASGGGSYLWNTGATTQSINVSPVITTSFSVTVTSNDGCIKSKDFTVTVDNCTIDCNECGNKIDFTYQNLKPDFINVFVLTNQNDIILSYTNGTSFSGLNPDLYKVYPINYDPASAIMNLESGKHISDVSSTCMDLGIPYLFKLCAKPNAMITGPLTMCTGETIVLTGNGGSQFEWSTGATTQSITVSPTSNTNYSVIVSNDICSDTVEVLVTVINCNTSCNLCDTYNCNIACNQFTNTISFNSTGGNSNLTTKYLLVDSESKIVKISDITNFTNVQPDLYFVFAINYDPGNPPSGLTEGGLFCQISGGCYDLSEPLVYKVCGSCSLGDYVWFDTNADGIQNSNEKGLDSVRIILYQLLPNSLDPTKMDTFAVDTTWSHSVIVAGDTIKKGFYEFLDLMPGNYFLIFENPDDTKYLISPKERLFNTTEDSNIYTNGHTDIINLSLNEHDPTIDAGFYYGECMKGVVWQENTSNAGNAINVYDNQDFLLNNIKVTVIYDPDPFNSNDDIEMFSDFTNSIGEYYFGLIPVGEYYLKIDLPSNLTTVIQDYGTDDNIDNDFFYSNVSGIYRSPNFSIGHNSDNLCYLNIDAGVEIITLAADILSFNVKWEENGKVVEISFESVNEINLSHYLIERKSENQSEFEQIAQIKAYEKSDINYYFLQDSEVEQGMRYYYKLIIVDKDGQHRKYFIDNVLIPGDKMTVLAYPNPSKSLLNIEIFGKQNQEVRVEIYDHIGKNSLKSVAIEKNSNSFEKVALDVSAIPQGNYFVKIISGNDISVKRIVVIK